MYRLKEEERKEGRHQSVEVIKGLIGEVSGKLGPSGIPEPMHTERLTPVMLPNCQE